MLSVGLLPEPEVRLDRLKRTCEWPPPPKTEVTPELSEIMEEAEERDEPPTLRADTQEDLTVEEGVLRSRGDTFAFDGQRGTLIEHENSVL